MITADRYHHIIGSCRLCSGGVPIFLPPSGFIKMSWSYIRQPRPQTDPATVRSARDLAQQPPTAGRSPPKTSDPPDCFLWGYLECVAYKSSPQTLVKLKSAVSAAVCVLSVATCLRSLKNLRWRAELWPPEMHAFGKCLVAR